MLSALRFLSPADSVEAVGCSCLARCDQGVVVQVEKSGEFSSQVNDVRACAEVLRRNGFSVRGRLVEAYAETSKAKELIAVADANDKLPDALQALNRAFGHATALGIGTTLSRPSSVLRMQLRSSSKASRFSIYQMEWLCDLLVARSRVYSSLSSQGWVRANSRALEDAQYAVQLAESLAMSLESAAQNAEVTDDEGVENARVILAARTSAWERLAESHEGLRDINGAISAYEKLLELEPPFSEGLGGATSAKRGVQELVLISHRRGRDDAVVVASNLQEVGAKAAEQVTTRALDDVKDLRRVVKRDLKTVETQVESNYPSALGFGDRARRDLEMLRKVVFSDINRLERNLLRGDPTIAFIRDLWNTAMGKPLESSGAALASIEGASWLRAQFEEGTFPEDPVLIAVLVEKARRDPELVTRLIPGATDVNREEILARFYQAMDQSVDEPASRVGP